MVSGPFEDGINVVGLMLARNEDWVIAASLRAALQWCDQVVLTLDRCTDKTKEIACAIAKELGGGRVIFHVTYDEDSKVWDEMVVRQENFTIGRRAGGTHFAIVDADEIPSENIIPVLRSWMKSLSPGQILDLPMIPVWGPGVVRDDDSVWTRAHLTVGFRDRGDLTFATPPGAYQHHNRPPKNALQNRMWPIDKGQGGVMHLQFANKRRLLAKHVLYRMVDHLRWPGRESVAELNAKYDQALSEPGKLVPLPGEWLTAAQASRIDLTGVPWQEAEIVRLLAEHGRERFAGLDLKGF